MKIEKAPGGAFLIGRFLDIPHLGVNRLPGEPSLEVRLCDTHNMAQQGQNVKELLDANQDTSALRPGSPKWRYFA
ncbi:hypothetical protein [Mesorhizobium carmichaelinearum]|uniref:hypothetical protein n=1 Tax=Mesorhizobium carmichaelinearum TaxID=1208188 RepID=UPI00117F6A49|nr:hypothetical protein [Mesorhizobium carmichaelinearum]